jgi:excinuclease ABC subunit C
MPEALEDVERQMREKASEGDYEEAARLRDTVSALRQMTKAHFVRKTPQMRRDSAKKALEELAEALGLKSPPSIIECVDISNLFGEHNVASLVVARDGIPDGRLYRHFKIKSFLGADDPRAMAEVVERRYSSESSISQSLPRADLFVCDGGITQLRAAREVFSALGISDIPTIALAEKQEEIVFDDGRENLLLPRDSEALFVLTRLRDEAHRFALSYHRKLRLRAIRESVLDEVPGIGEAKKMKLLRHFRSVRGIARASVEEIAACAGVSSSTAEEVRNRCQK